MVKKNEIERKSLETKIKVLTEYRIKHEEESRELKRKQKKLLKKGKKDLKKAAEEELKKMRIEREATIVTIEETESFVEEVEKNVFEPNTESLETCEHYPQCISREPLPPPLGPLTLQQFETEALVEKKEEEIKAVETFVKAVLKFMKKEPGDTLDVTVAKLEALKKLLEPEIKDEEPSEFDNLIETVKNTQELLDSIVNSNIEEDDYEYLNEPDDLPPHYWGGEDGNEIIFYEEE